MKPFRNFPYRGVAFSLLFRLFTGDYPKHVSFVNSVLHNIVEYSKPFQKEGLWVGWFFQPLVFICNEDFTKILLNSDAALDKPMVFYDLVSECIGNGVFYIPGSKWKKYRKMLNPAFRPNVVKSHTPAFNKIAKSLVRQLSERSNEPSVDVATFLRLGALKVFSETTFEINTEDPKYEQIFYETDEAFERLKTYTVGRFVRPWLYFKTIQLLSEDGRQHEKNIKQLKYFAEYMVGEILNSSSLQKTDDLGESKSLSRLLIEHHMKDPSFTVDDICEEVRLFLVASYETSFSTMLWCLFMLAVHPEIQERVFEELESLAGNSDAEININDLNELKYLESVIKETMRLFPVFPLLGRKLSEDIEFGKYKVPKNTCILFSPYMLHRDPDIYPDPDKFDPGRFYEKSLKHPWAYIPFAEGIRNCIGKNFAMVEMKIFLGHIIRNFRVTSLERKEDIEVDWKVSLNPHAPIRFRLFPRKSDL